MAISEESRHRLYSRLEEVLGPEDASTMMEHLPPVGWADVATKRDLDHMSTLHHQDMTTLGAELRGEMASLRGELCVEIARAAAETRAGMRTLFLGLVGLQMSGAGLALAVAKLA